MPSTATSSTSTWRFRSCRCWRCCACASPGTRPAEESRSERALTLAACVAQGLSYVYYSAFACALLAFAAPIGLLRTRSWRLPLRAIAAIALLVASTAAVVAPSALYWRRHGYNPDLDYKPPAETDTYGLKLRHLLVPIAEHPLPPLRALAAKVEAVDFPGDNENVLSKLGSAGSLGLLALAGLLLGRAAGALREDDDRLAGAAALTLVTLLLANVGGLASLFSVFVSPDVRCWARIVVFLSFLCLLAFGELLSRAARSAGGRLRTAWQRPAAAAGLAALLLCGLLDQVPLERLAALREGSAAAFEEERGLVRAVEAQLPAGAMVFQLPDMTVPVDRATDPPMLYYDPGRMYLHSRSLRWSWGAMIGRNRDWGRAVAALPVAERLRVLALAGFSGLWIDRWGYTGARRPPFATLEAGIAAVVGTSPATSARGRYSFFTLEPFRQRLEAELGPERVAHQRAEVLADMPIARWSSGCGEEQHADAGWWRTCGASAVLELRNWRPGAIRIDLRARLRSGTGPASVVISGPGFEDRVELATDPRSYGRVFEMDGTDNRPPVLLAPRRELVTLRAVSPTPCPAAGCFEVGDVALETRRLIGGVAVNADGGVAVRTKY